MKCLYSELSVSTLKSLVYSQTQILLLHLQIEFVEPFQLALLIYYTKHNAPHTHLPMILEMGDHARTFQTLLSR